MADADGMLAGGGRAEDAAFGSACENAILDAMRAERRLCASFSFARFTRLTTSRIASPAFLTAASRPPSPFGSSSSWDELCFRRLSRSWSSSNGYLHIR